MIKLQLFYRILNLFSFHIQGDELTHKFDMKLRASSKCLYNKIKTWLYVDI